MTTYSAVILLSGLVMPPESSLALNGGLVIGNSVTHGLQSSDDHPANVIPDGQTGEYLKKFARWLLILTTYEYRGVLRHGDTRPEIIQKAHDWLGQNVHTLQEITASAFQRVLRLASDQPDLDVLAHAGKIQQGDMSSLDKIQQMPIFGYPRCAKSQL